eukprot:385713_1
MTAHKGFEFVELAFPEDGLKDGIRLVQLDVGIQSGTGPKELRLEAVVRDPHAVDAVEIGIQVAFIGGVKELSLEWECLRHDLCKLMKKELSKAFPVVDSEAAPLAVRRLDVVRIVHVEVRHIFGAAAGYDGRVELLVEPALVLLGGNRQVGEGEVELSPSRLVDLIDDDDGQDQGEGNTEVGPKGLRLLVVRLEVNAPILGADEQVCRGVLGCCLFWLIHGGIKRHETVDAPRGRIER